MQLKRAFKYWRVLIRLTQWQWCFKFPSRPADVLYIYIRNLIWYIWHWHLLCSAETLSVPFPSIPGFSPSRSLNCSSSEAQGVSREFVQLWQGRVVFPQCSLKIGRLSTPGLSAGPLSSHSGTAGNSGEASKYHEPVSHTHAWPRYSHTQSVINSTRTYCTCVHKELKSSAQKYAC